MISRTSSYVHTNVSALKGESTQVDVCREYRRDARHYYLASVHFPGLGLLEGNKILPLRRFSRVAPPSYLDVHSQDPVPAPEGEV